VCQLPDRGICFVRSCKSTGWYASICVAFCVLYTQYLDQLPLMKHLVSLVFVAWMAAHAATNGAEVEMPAGTCVLSDDGNFFGRLTVTRTGEFTGTLRDSFDDAQYGRRVFAGRLSFGGEVDCLLRYPQATYYHPFGPHESLTIRHTPDGPTEYAATMKVTYGNRIGPPSIFTYDLLAYRILNDPAATGQYTLLFRPVPGTGYGVAPDGTGWAVLRLSSTGSFRCVGKLANGESFSFGFDARADRRLDLFRFQSPATFYPRKGGKLHTVFNGTIVLRDVPDISDADGVMQWEDPVTLDEEFLTEVSIIASRYVPTRDAGSLLSTDVVPRPKLGVASFSDASFPEPKRAMFRFEVPPMVLPESTQLMPKLSWMTQGGAFPGRFHGIVRPGVRTRAFSGVFFSKQRTAEGFFLKHGGSGVVRLGVKED
jgi:hypothetical protein